MSIKTLGNIAISMALTIPSSTLLAQGGASGVYWRLDPSVKSCSMVIDRSLTQDQWHEFTTQCGDVASFKSLGSAKTLGNMNFQVAVDYASTHIDQHSLAWINTFVHPDENCPLGDAIKYPVLRARMGVADNIDIGGYWITAANANYGMCGGEVKYAFLPQTDNFPAAAVRGSVSLITGVPDFDLNTYSIDLLASKDIATFTPYLGIRTSLVVGNVTTSKVNLRTETVPTVQGYAGVVYSFWILNVAAEYNVATVNTLALSMGVKF